MEREIIRNQLKEKFNSSLILQLLTNFVEEFQECFGQYLQAEEIIKRLKDNVVSIIIEEQFIKGYLDGQYDIKTGIIKLHKSVLEDKDMCGYLAFHELIHAITAKSLGDGRKIMGFSFITNSLGMGLNEAMTEWLTQIRNKKRKVDYNSGYKTVVEQIVHLASIIGEEKLIKCFLFESEKLEELLIDNNIDYKELEQSFYSFVGKDEEVWRLGNEHKLNEIYNYGLYRQAQILLDNYSRACGNIDSIDTFKRKYQILGDYKEQDVNLNKIMRYHYYNGIFDDIDMLIQKGIPIKEIRDALEMQGILSEEFHTYSKLRKIFLRDKNQISKLLYKFYSLYPEEFYNFAFQNYGLLYDVFSETTLIPEEKVLYDVDRYLAIGEFLLQHPHYEYDEISTKKYKTSSGVSIYYFTTLDQSKFIYTIPHYNVEILDENKFRIIMQEGDIILNLGEQASFESHSNNGEPITISVEYSEYSQLDDVEYCMIAEEFIADRDVYEEKSRKIRERIAKKNLNKNASMIEMQNHDTDDSADGPDL